MRLVRTCSHEVEIPEGEYCQRADGSVSCKYYYYEIDPIFGSGFYCHEFGAHLMCLMTIFLSAQRETLKSAMLA